MQKNASSSLSLIFPDFGSASDPFAEAIDSHFRYSDALAVQDRQEMINHHSLCLGRLRRAADEASSLRRENDSLRSLNVEMSKKLRLLIQSSLARTALGREKTGTAATSVDVGRFLLPKSIYVKSGEYLKAARSSGDNGGRARSFTASRTDALQNVKQKVYVMSRGKRQDEEPLLGMEVKKQGSFKTELCNKWRETGECPYGAQCQFAHGVEELRPVTRHPRYKTEVCRMVLAGVACPYGHRCHFLHAVAAGAARPCRPVSLING